MRKEFFAFRNGIIADKLRRAGDPHSIIMGCLLVDIQDIAKRQCEAIGDNILLAAIASELWRNTQSRECRLAAPMLYPAPLMAIEEAHKWCQEVESTEVADNLCHKLLRHINSSETLFRVLIDDERQLVKYTGYRLLLNLIILGKVQLDSSLRAIAEHEFSKAPQGPLALLLKSILDKDD